MLKFTLTNYFNGAIINNIFLELVKKYYKFLILPIQINQIEGTPPFNTWNGGFNINKNNNILLNPDLSKLTMISKSATLRLNCSNICLEEHDFNDNYHKQLLQALDNGSTAIQITSLKGYEFLKHHYNFSKYILSENAVCLQPYTPEVINTILENIDFNLLQIPNIYRSDFEFLSQINDPSKIEICINPICPIYCQNYFECIYYENQAQLNFSDKSYFQNCIKTFDYTTNMNIIPIEQLNIDYVPLGITNFYLCTCPENQLEQYLQFLLNYFFKQEHIQHIINNEPLVQKIIYGCISNDLFENLKKI